MDVLLNMEKGSPRRNGEIYFTDPRLVANGFQIKLIPGNFKTWLLAFSWVISF